jgi:plasmid maintenance system antidote protein VapI
VKDEKALGDLMLLILTTLADLGEATTYEIYQVHRGKWDDGGPVLPLQSAYQFIRRLEDMGMVSVSRTAPHVSLRGEMLDIPYFVVTDLGRLALEHRKGQGRVSKHAPENRDYRKSPRTLPAASYLRDELTARGMTVDEFAAVTMLPRKTLDAILDDRIPISLEVSERLGVAFETSPTFWFDIDQGHRESINHQHGDGQHET